MIAVVVLMVLVSEYPLLDVVSVAVERVMYSTVKALSFALLVCSLLQVQVSQVHYERTNQH